MSRISRVLSPVLLTPLLAAVGCDHGQASTSTPPEAAATESDADTADPFTAEPETAAAEPSPEKKAAPEVAKRKDVITVGTFNLNWAFDEVDDRSEIANEYNADSEEAWDWKLESIAKILKQEDLDVVAVQSLGGERELLDLVVKIREIGGPNYNTAFVESEDKHLNLQMAVLSKNLVMDETRFEARVPRHMVAEISLPDGGRLAIVNVHLRGGSYKIQREARTRQAEKIKRKAMELGETMPVLITGDMTGDVPPKTEGYRESAPGILAGASTRADDDDCTDSAKFPSARETDTEGKPNDRVLACGLEMLDAKIVARDEIIRGSLDPEGSKWFEVPVDSGDLRDVSDHLLVRTEIKLPSEDDEDQQDEK